MLCSDYQNGSETSAFLGLIFMNELYVETLLFRLWKVVTYSERKSDNNGLLSEEYFIYLLCLVFDILLHSWILVKLCH